MPSQHLILSPAEAPHCPTSDSRELVAGMVACGLDYLQIAFVLKCDPSDVKRHYADELEHGTALCNARVGAALLRNCIAGDTNAQKFWLMTRAGWAPPTPEDQKKNQKTVQLTQEKKSIMDEIFRMVAKGKEKEEVAAATAKVNRAGVQ